MYIICMFEKYYVRINELNTHWTATWDEIYNPHFATAFKSMAEARKWLLKNTNLIEYAVPVLQDEALEKYDKWMNAGSVRRTINFIDNNLSRKYNNESAEDVLAWRLAIEPDKMRFADYKSWPDLHQKFQNLFSVQTFHNEEYTEKFTSVELYFKKSANFEIFTKELNLVLPKITRIKDGYKIFNVFDRFLSEGGDSVTFCYRSDEDCMIDGRWSTRIKGSLRTCFDYLIKERYYED